ncbi:Phosphotransferase enzyme family protein [Bacillus sp. THAF10]|uniref:phosphotransferase family protein n=1 Tax=Bacillus sp. THAF10 TaxID=2587848 RepID=UPI001267AE9E|nr:aminoglycoside phosphotransferase family protein [Bacillus sp. THAF10]QFT87974.1 Phosphotransferase enzyme family protein [Bacillus sp. THAF10]
MKLGTPFAAGNTANIYLKNNTAIKIYHNHIPETASSYEASKQMAAYECGLSVPKILEVIDNALVMEYVNGQTVGQLALADMNQASYYLELSVNVQREIHHKNPNNLESMKDKLQRQIAMADSLDSVTKSKLIAKLSTMTYKPKLCHGDFHLHNLIKSKERIYIIDWVDATLGDIRADVYRSYLLYSQVSVDLAEMYISLYCQKSGLTKEAIFEWAPIIAAARLAENVQTESQERLLSIVQENC